jgi:hypothetical protein
LDVRNGKQIQTHSVRRRKKKDHIRLPLMVPFATKMPGVIREDDLMLNLRRLLVRWKHGRQGSG